MSLDPAAQSTHGAPRPLVAFLGAGRMGVPMARNLLANGFPLTVWNRTPAKAWPVAADGATIAESAASAVETADVVVTMLQDEEAVRHLLFDQGVAQAMRPGSTFIDMSSIPPRAAIEHAALLGERGLGSLDAPVSGGTLGASNATLTILVGGPPEEYARHEALLRSFGRPNYIGPAGAGQTAKLANQIIVATAIEGVAEALLLVAAAGLDPNTVQQALSGGFAESRVLTEHGRRMILRDFVAGGAVELHLKDMVAALATASDLNLHLPLTERVTEMFRHLVESGNADSDHSALLLELERLNPPYAIKSNVHPATGQGTTG